MALSIRLAAMLYFQDAESVRIKSFEANTVVANPEPNIARAFQAFDIADSRAGVVGQGTKDLDGVLTIDPPQIGLGVIRPAKVTLQGAPMSEAKFPENLFVRRAGTGLSARGFNRLALGVRFGFAVFGRA
jgi:hypothetical protein